jgi:hypothetical protein
MPTRRRWRDEIDEDRQTVITILEAANVSPR